MVTTSRPFFLGLAALSLALTAAACNDLEKIDEGTSSGDAIPEAVQLAFDETCALSSCHDSAAAGGLDLSAAASPSIIGGPSTSPLPMVDPGNVDGSYLAVKMLESPPDGVTRTGARMPIGGDFDDPNNLVILGWIATLDPSAGADGGTTTGETSDDSSGGTTGEMLQACGLDDIAPGATSPFDIGMDAGQIPPDVGAVLDRNCAACHGADTAELVGDPAPPAYTGMLSFLTLTEIEGTYNDLPITEVLLGRVEAGTMPPTYFCNLGGGEVITAEDQQLLVDWLNAGAPDAPTWSG